MGNRFSLSVGSKEAKTDPPSPDWLDLPVPPRVLEEGGPSSPPEVINHVIPETVVLVTRAAEAPVAAPLEPLLVEKEQDEKREDELEEELSRYEQGLYDDDYQLEPISEGDEGGEESDEDPEMDEEEQYLEYYPEPDHESETIRLSTYRLMSESDWDRLWFRYGLRRTEPTFTEDGSPCCPPKWRRATPRTLLVRIPCDCAENVQRDVEDGVRSPEPCDPGPSRRRSLSSDEDDESRPKMPCMDSRVYRKRFGAP